MMTHAVGEPRIRISVEQDLTSGTVRVDREIPLLLVEPGPLPDDFMLAEIREMLAELRASLPQ